MDELVKGVGNLNHYLHTQACEVRNSLSKKSKGKHVASVAPTDLVISLDFSNESSLPDAGDVASSLERYINDKEEEDEDKD